MMKHVRHIELDKPKEENSYYQSCLQYFDDLLDLVERCPGKYSLKLNAKGRKREPDAVPQYKKLNEWINKVTAFKLADPFYTTSTKCYWILHDLHDFPTCHGCGKNENFKHVNVHLQSGYSRNCSVKCRQSDPLTLKHRMQTCREKYGVDNPYQNEHIKRKCELKKLEKHNDPHFTNRHKARETFKKHCEEDPCFLKNANSKKRATSMKNFGYENPAQCPDIISKAHKKYMYDGIMFDSSYEIAYLMWMHHNGTNVEKAQKTFTYEFNGKIHYYIPDFYIPDEGVYVELKGSQFFKSSDGTMMIPWRKKSWTDEEYALRCQQEEAKHQCMIANNVKIILDTDVELKQAFKYVESIYGKDYIKQFRYRKTSNKLKRIA